MSELPKGWLWATLGEVTHINMGQSPKGSSTNSEGVGLPLVGGAADFEGDVLITSRFTSAPTKICSLGDLVLCIRATIGKVAIADKEFCLGRGVAGLTPLVSEPGYLRYFLTFEADNLDRAGTGTTFRQIDKQKLSSWPIPLPSRNEQRRIVLKLDSFFERTRRARKELSHIPLLIEHYKQAILTAGFRGDLTADWRIRHGKPASWAMGSVGEAIADIRYGTSKKCTPERHGTPILRIPNVTSEGIDLNNLKYTDLTQKEFEKLSLESGDVLVVRSNGSVDLVGRSVVVGEHAVGYAYAGYLIRLRPNLDRINPLFLNLMLSSPQTRKTIEVNARSTSGVHNINSEELQALPVPIPPLDEQNEAVRLITKSFDWLRSVADEVKKASTLLDHLDQAHLGKAFQGRLVPQDPSDEPASVFLERIRAERATQPKAKRVRRSKNVPKRKASA